MLNSSLKTRSHSSPSAYDACVYASCGVSRSISPQLPAILGTWPVALTVERPPPACSFFTYVIMGYPALVDRQISAEHGETPTYKSVIIDATNSARQPRFAKPLQVKMEPVLSVRRSRAGSGV